MTGVGSGLGLICQHPIVVSSEGMIGVLSQRLEPVLRVGTL